MSEAYVTHSCEIVGDDEAVPEYWPYQGWVLLFSRYHEPRAVEVFFCPLCGVKLPNPPQVEA